MPRRDSKGRYLPRSSSGGGGGGGLLGGGATTGKRRRKKSSALAKAPRASAPSRSGGGVSIRLERAHAGATLENRVSILERNQEQIVHGVVAVGSLVGRALRSTMARRRRGS